METRTNSPSQQPGVTTDDLECHAEDRNYERRDQHGTDHNRGAVCHQPKARNKAGRDHGIAGGTRLRRHHEDKTWIQCPDSGSLVSLFCIICRCFREFCGWGSGSDFGYGIAVDGSGNAYITGFTASSNFPIQNPYQGTNAGDTDLFIAKLTSTAPPIPALNQWGLLALSLLITGVGFMIIRRRKHASV